MDAIVSTMNHLVSVSAFNKGAAGAIFSSVKQSGEPKLVLRRNEPECVLISPKEYAKLIEEIEDLKKNSKANLLHFANNIILISDKVMPN